MSTEDFKKIFSENLTYYLDLKGKSQADLYRYMNVSSATASDWCNGKKLPRMDKIQSICNWLGIEKSNLLTPRSQEHSIDYLRATDLVNIYYNGVLHWTEELGLSERDTCILRNHFADLLLRYKTLIEHYTSTNIRWDAEKEDFSKFYKTREHTKTIAEIHEMYLDQELKSDLENLENWIKAFPNWISQNTEESTDFPYLLNAAHNDEESTKEERKAGDAIMTDDSEWE